MIKLSAGTAHVLGLRKLAIDALPYTAYLMSGEKCTHDCGFCPQARNASSRADMLSRVTWSEGEINEIATGVGRAFQRGQMKRACLQVVDGCDILNQVKENVRKIREHSEIPICVSTKVRTVEEVLALAETGVDRIGLALDGASEGVFKKTKTGNWAETLRLIEDSARVLPGRISTHLIVGLGESEEEMAAMLQHMWDLDVTVGLFAFTPVPGTRMAGEKAPDLAVYRRMQAANYLIKHKKIYFADCRFSDGKLISFGLSEIELTDYLKCGKAFETSGCPDCNRPYYNEKPGGVMYNYPRPLKPEETEAALKLLLNSLTWPDDGGARENAEGALAKDPTAPKDGGKLG